MKETKETFYCDICKKEIECDNPNASPSTINLNYNNSGGRKRFEHVCQICTKRIEILIEELYIK